MGEKVVHSCSHVTADGIVRGSAAVPHCGSTDHNMISKPALTKPFIHYLLITKRILFRSKAMFCFRKVYNSVLLVFSSRFCLLCCTPLWEGLFTLQSEDCTLLCEYNLTFIYVWSFNIEFRIRIEETCSLWAQVPLLTVWQSDRNAVSY